MDDFQPGFAKMLTGTLPPFSQCLAFIASCFHNHLSVGTLSLFIALSFTIMGGGYTKQQQILQVFVLAGTVVVALGVGLPPAVALALAFAITRTQKNNDLVRLLGGCETSGNATTICSDKTGIHPLHNTSAVAGSIGPLSRFGVRNGEGGSMSITPIQGHATTPKSDVSVVSSPEYISSLSKDVKGPLRESMAVNLAALKTAQDGHETLVESKTEIAQLSLALAMGSLYEESFNAYNHNARMKNLESDISSKLKTFGGRLRAALFNSWINVLLVMFPVGIGLSFACLNPVVIFAINFIAIIPLAATLGYLVEEIAPHRQETAGGLLDIPLWNAVELGVALKEYIWTFRGCRGLVHNPLEVAPLSLWFSLLFDTVSSLRSIAPYYLAAVASDFFSSLWLYGVYAYPYSQPYQYSNAGREVNEKLPVACICAQYSVCGCDDQDDSASIDLLEGNGNPATGNGISAPIMTRHNNAPRSIYRFIVPTPVRGLSVDRGSTYRSKSSGRKRSSANSFWPIMAIASMIPLGSALETDPLTRTQTVAPNQEWPQGSAWPSISGWPFIPLAIVFFNLTSLWAKRSGPNGPLLVSGVMMGVLGVVWTMIEKDVTTTPIVLWTTFVLAIVYTFEYGELQFRRYKMGLGYAILISLSAIGIACTAAQAFKPAEAAVLDDGLVRFLLPSFDLSLCIWVYGASMAYEQYNVDTTQSRRMEEGTATSTATAVATRSAD